MRRRILEWTLWLCITGLLGVISLAAAAFLVPRSQSFIAVGSRFHALLRPGWIDMGSTLDTSSGYPAPAIVNPRNIIAPKVIRSGSVNLPGVNLTFCLFQRNPPDWSLRMSLFVPLVLSLILIAIVFYRLKRLERAGLTPKPKVPGAIAEPRPPAL
jgi:hypothetical protein